MVGRQSSVLGLQITGRVTIGRSTKATKSDLKSDLWFYGFMCNPWKDTIVSGCIIKLQQRMDGTNMTQWLVSRVQKETLRTVWVFKEKKTCFLKHCIVNLCYVSHWAHLRGHKNIITGSYNGNNRIWGLCMHFRNVIIEKPWFTCYIRKWWTNDVTNFLLFPKHPVLACWSRKCLPS